MQRGFRHPIQPLSRMPFALLLALFPAFQTAGGGFDKKWAVYGDLSNDLMGYSLAMVGDLNGDGVGDLAAGAVVASPNGLPNAGVLRILSGSDGSEIFRLEGSQASENLGRAVLSLSDRNGDGIPDLAVGGGGQGNGEVRIHSGADGALLAVFAAPGGADDFGESLASPGDTNGDGFDEILVGASGSDLFGFTNSGGAFLISGVDGSVMTLYTLNQDFAYFGGSVSCPGDLDADGTPDLFIGALWADPGGIQRAGSAFLYSTQLGTLIYRFDGILPSQRFGEAVSGAGDANGDGTVDLAVGAPADYQNGSNWEGSVTIFSGATGLEMHKFRGMADLEEFGGSLASVGDVDEDGCDDLLVGAPGTALGGRVYIFSGLTGSRLWISESEGWGHEMGATVATTGDLDGDGFLEFAAGATRAWNQGPTPGAAYLYEFKPFLTASTTTLSGSAGGTVTWDLDFPPDWVYEPTRNFYALLGSGSSGQTEIYGWQVPLAFDPLFQSTLAGNYPAILNNPAGPLDAFGDATVSLSLPVGGGLNLIGRTFHIAAGCYELTTWGVLMIHGISRAVTLEFVP